MKTRTLIVAAVAGAFALPLSVQAAGEAGTFLLAQSSSQGASSGHTAGAQSAAPGGGMSTLDKDSDGYVSREEAAADTRVHSRFSELDTNRDGRLSHSESQDFRVAAPPAGADAGASGGSAAGSGASPGSR